MDKILNEYAMSLDIDSGITTDELKALGVNYDQ